ncbi:MAG TPA: hypothetical protein VM163_01310, partial [bacterium]|nr:hypothetical protein [bacterium]
QTLQKLWLSLLQNRMQYNNDCARASQDRRSSFGAWRLERATREIVRQATSSPLPLGRRN